MNRKVRILVVDDEQIVLDSVVKHLRKEDYEIECVLSASAALERVRSNGIDIVLTDLMMPEIDGLELMEQLKQDHPELPIIMITGYATINTALQATQLGAFDYIAKPFSRAELKSVVKRAVDSIGLLGNDAAAVDSDTKNNEPRTRYRTIGDDSWIMLQEDGSVVFGVEHSFLNMIGRIQNIYLPKLGDELRQGSTYLQIFSSDMRSHTVLSPLSGEVVAVNDKVISQPEQTLQDPYGDGWLIRIKPSRFDEEIKVLGL
jgi:CheY-like chemotaxis protein/glycine cleavage system H lipoate-binding protein